MGRMKKQELVVHRSCCCSIFRYQVHSHYTRTSCV